MTAYDPKRPRRQPRPTDEPAPVDALIDLSSPMAQVAATALRPTGTGEGAEPTGVVAPGTGTLRPDAPPVVTPEPKRAGEAPMASVRAVPAVEGPDEVLSGRARTTAVVAAAVVALGAIAVVVAVRRRGR